MLCGEDKAQGTKEGGTRKGKGKGGGGRTKKKNKRRISRRKLANEQDEKEVIICA